MTGRLAIRIIVEVPRLLTDGNLSRPGCQIGSKGGPRQKFSSSLNRPLVNVRLFPTFAKPAQSRTFHGYSDVPRLSRGTSNRVGPFFSQIFVVPNFCYLVILKKKSPDFFLIFLAFLRIFSSKIWRSHHHLR